MGFSAWPLSRYSRRRPSSRTSTAPTSRSTRRCLETCGCASPSSRTRSFTGRSRSAMRSRICRRRGSATALNASAVVAARATTALYTYMGIRCLGLGADARGLRDRLGLRRRRAEHARGRVRVVLVERLVLEERRRQGVELAAVLLEQRHHLFVRL